MAIKENTLYVPYEKERTQEAKLICRAGQQVACAPWTFLHNPSIVVLNGIFPDVLALCVLRVINFTLDQKKKKFSV